MARCYQLTKEQSQRWTHGDGWDALRIEEDIQERMVRDRVREPVVVITDDHGYAFAMTHEQVRA